MNKALRKTGVHKYKNKIAGFDWCGLMDYATNVLNSRDKIAEGLPTPPFSKEKAEEAVKAEVPYLQYVPVPIDPATFRKKCAELEQLYIDKGVFHGIEQLEVVMKFDWEKLSDDTIAKAGVSPNEFFLGASNELCPGDDSVASILLAGLLVNVVRAFLSGTGEEMTEFMSKQDKVRTSDQPSLCPTCGEPPTLAAVLEGQDNSGNARRLYCVCCGTVWPYERIRCAHCGTRNTTKLKYVHTEEDTAHRMYVCDECGTYMPTVFQGALGTDIDYDIEQTALSILESLYLNEKAKEAEAKAKSPEAQEAKEQDKDKPTDDKKETPVQ